MKKRWIILAVLLLASTVGAYLLDWKILLAVGLGWIVVAIILAARELGFW